MAGSAGWAMVTYRELALLLEQRNSFSLETSSRGQAFVVGVRICEVTGNWSLREGLFFFCESLFQLKDWLFGSVVKMLTDILNFLQRCQVLLKKTLEVFPQFQIRNYIWCSPRLSTGASFV